MSDKAIGGYFELELPNGNEFHEGALKLNSGKNCLEYILRARKYSKVYVPYFTCEVVLDPFNKLGVECEFYHINNWLEIASDIELREGEALLYTNYWGLKQRYVGKLVAKYGNQLIVDNTQAFFAKPFNGIDTFYTCRKFFGVPDGAYLYCDTTLDVELGQSVSYNRFEHLLKRIDLSSEDGFADYHKNEEELESQPIRIMSNLSQRLMLSIDYYEVMRKRRTNFELLHFSLGDTNLFNLPLEEDAVPMVYPYLTSDSTMKHKLITNKIFVATYWPNVLAWCKEGDVEKRLTKNTCFLPIDQRYGDVEMKKIIEILQK